jgi:hypothetical protein
MSAVTDLVSFLTREARTTQSASPELGPNVVPESHPDVEPVA